MTFREKKMALAIIMALFIFVALMGFDMYNKNKELKRVIEENKVVIENTWKIESSDLKIIEGSVEANRLPRTEGFRSDCNITLNPTEKYEYTYKINNNGSINAKIDAIYSVEVPQYINYTVEYEDGTPLAKNHLLKANESETIRVKVEYLENEETIEPITLEIYNFINYTSDDGNGFDRKNLNHEKYLTEESLTDEEFDQVEFGGYVIAAVFALALLAIAVIAVFLLKTEAD